MIAIILACCCFFSLSFSQSLCDFYGFSDACWADQSCCWDESANQCVAGRGCATPKPTPRPTPAPTPTPKPTPRPQFAPTTPRPTPATDPPSLAPTTPEPTPVLVTRSPTAQPTGQPTAAPSPQPTMEPSVPPTPWPTLYPTPAPTIEPTTPRPTPRPTPWPTPSPTNPPPTTPAPTTPRPTPFPSLKPTPQPTPRPTPSPSPAPTDQPTSEPTGQPTTQPTALPTGQPTALPTPRPTAAPTVQPTPLPPGQTTAPTPRPTSTPTASPSPQPTPAPTTPAPTGAPTTAPTGAPTSAPTPAPTAAPRLVSVSASADVCSVGSLSSGVTAGGLTTASPAGPVELSVVHLDDSDFGSAAGSASACQSTVLRFSAAPGCLLLGTPAGLDWTSGCGGGAAKRQPVAAARLTLEFAVSDSFLSPTIEIGANNTIVFSQQAQLLSNSSLLNSVRLVYLEFRSLGPPSAGPQSVFVDVTGPTMAENQLGLSANLSTALIAPQGTLELTTDATGLASWLATSTPNPGPPAVPGDLPLTTTVTISRVVSNGSPTVVLAAAGFQRADRFFRTELVRRATLGLGTAVDETETLATDLDTALDDLFAPESTPLPTASPTVEGQTPAPTPVGATLAPTPQPTRPSIEEVVPPSRAANQAVASATEQLADSLGRAASAVGNATAAAAGSGSNSGLPGGGSSGPANQTQCRQSALDDFYAEHGQTDLDSWVSGLALQHALGDVPTSIDAVAGPSTVRVCPGANFTLGDAVQLRCLCQSLVASFRSSSGGVVDGSGFGSGPGNGTSSQGPAVAQTFGSATGGLSCRWPPYSAQELRTALNHSDANGSAQMPAGFQEEGLAASATSTASLQCDARREAWFGAAAYAPRHTLVVLDVMSDSLCGDVGKLARAQELAHALLDTLNPADRVALVVPPLLGQAFRCLNSQMAPADPATLGALHAQINEVTKLCSSDQFPPRWSLDEAIQASVRLLAGARNETCTNLVILVTGDQTVAAGFANELSSDEQAGILDAQLYVYAPAAPAATATELRQATCEVNGVFTNIPVVGNVLTPLDSMFQRLAVAAYSAGSSQGGSMAPSLATAESSDGRSLSVASAVLDQSSEPHRLVGVVSYDVDLTSLAKSIARTGTGSPSSDADDGDDVLITLLTPGGGSIGGNERVDSQSASSVLGDADDAESQYHTAPGGLVIAQTQERKRPNATRLAQLLNSATSGRCSLARNRRRCFLLDRSGRVVVAADDTMSGGGVSGAAAKGSFEFVGARSASAARWLRDEGLLVSSQRLEWGSFTNCSVYSVNDTRLDVLVVAAKERAAALGVHQAPIIAAALSDGCPSGEAMFRRLSPELYLLVLTQDFDLGAARCGSRSFGPKCNRISLTDVCATYKNPLEEQFARARPDRCPVGATRASVEQLDRLRKPDEICAAEAIDQLTGAFIALFFILYGAVCAVIVVIGFRRRARLREKAAADGSITIDLDELKKSTGKGRGHASDKRSQFAKQAGSEAGDGYGYGLSRRRSRRVTVEEQGGHSSGGEGRVGLSRHTSRRQHGMADHSRRRRTGHSSDDESDDNALAYAMEDDTKALEQILSKKRSRRRSRLLSGGETDSGRRHSVRRELEAYNDSVAGAESAVEYDFLPNEMRTLPAGKLSAISENTVNNGPNLPKDSEEYAVEYDVLPTEMQHGVSQNALLDDDDHHYDNEDHNEGSADQSQSNDGGTRGHRSRKISDYDYLQPVSARSSRSVASTRPGMGRRRPSKAFAAGGVSVRSTQSSKASGAPAPSQQPSRSSSKPSFAIDMASVRRMETMQSASSDLQSDMTGQYGDLSQAEVTARSGKSVGGSRGVSPRSPKKMSTVELKELSAQIDMGQSYGDLNATELSPGRNDLSVSGRTNIRSSPGLRGAQKATEDGQYGDLNVNEVKSARSRANSDASSFGLPAFARHGRRGPAGSNASTAVRASRYLMGQDVASSNASGANEARGAQYDVVVGDDRRAGSGDRSSRLGLGTTGAGYDLLDAGGVDSQTSQYAEDLPPELLSGKGGRGRRADPDYASLSATSNVPAIKYGTLSYVEQPGPSQGPRQQKPSHFEKLAMGTAAALPSPRYRADTDHPVVPAFSSALRQQTKSDASTGASQLQLPVGDNRVHATGPASATVRQLSETSALPSPRYSPFRDHRAQVPPSASSNTHNTMTGVLSANALKSPRYRPDLDDDGTTSYGGSSAPPSVMSFTSSVPAAARGSGNLATATVGSIVPFPESLLAAPTANGRVSQTASPQKPSHENVGKQAAQRTGQRARSGPSAKPKPTRKSSKRHAAVSPASKSSSRRGWMTNLLDDGYINARDVMDVSGSESDDDRIMTRTLASLGTGSVKSAVVAAKPRRPRALSRGTSRRSAGQRVTAHQPVAEEPVADALNTDASAESLSFEEMSTLGSFASLKKSPRKPPMSSKKVSRRRSQRK